MSNFNFKVNNYRIIKNADVSPSGVTLLYGKNGSGKSTLLKSLVTLLSNKHSEDNFRHGENSYSIMASVDGNQLAYQRKDTTAQLFYNDEVPRSKLGQGDLASVEPRFPLKRLQFDDDVYYPNFSFQNKTIFDSVEPSQLFSLMFSDVANVSQRVTQLKKDTLGTAKVRNDSQVTSDMFKEKVTTATKEVEVIKAANPNLEDTYSYLKGLVEKKENFTKFMLDYQRISSECSDEEKRKLVALYKEAQPLFSDLVFTQKVHGILMQITQANDDLLKVKEKNTKFNVVFPVNVHSLVSGVNQLSTVQSSLSVVRRDYGLLPQVSSGLISSGSTLINLKKTLDGVRLEFQQIPVVSSTLLSEVRDLQKAVYDLSLTRASLVEVNAEYEVITKRLKEFPCDRYLNKVCPFQEQIKVGG